MRSAEVRPAAMLRRTPVTATLLLTATLPLTLGACSGAARPEAAPPSPPLASPSHSDRSPSDRPTGPDPTPTPEPSATTQPRVLAVHPSRAPLSVSLALARRIAAGRVSSWAPLAGDRTPLEVLSLGPGQPPPRALGQDTVLVMPASRLRPGLAPIEVNGLHPVRRPTAYPWQVAGPAPGAVTTLRFGGDVMLARRVASATPGPDPAAALRPLAAHLRAADLTVVNLESALSTSGPPQQGEDSFAAPPATPAALARLGIDAVSLANNHTGDFGSQALVETVGLVRDSPVRGFGAGATLSGAARPAVVRAGSLRIGLVGFNSIGETPAATRTSPGALSVRMPPRTGPLNEPDLRRVTGIVRRLATRVDVVVVLPHWGAQYTHEAEPVQRTVARRLAAAGADLVVGGHPHWVQGLEVIGDTVVAHSLGNLVFDMDFMTQTMEGVTLTATYWDDRLMAVELTAYRLDARFRPRLLTPEQARPVLADVWSHSRRPFALEQ